MTNPIAKRGLGETPNGANAREDGCHLPKSRAMDVSAMNPVLRILKRRGLELTLLGCGAHLAWLMYAAANASSPDEVPSLRNQDFPLTYIARIHLDLTGPNSYVTLTWLGPHAASQHIGPFHSSPGAGWGTNDCNDVVESNCPNSMCTPKGLRKVEGFMNHLKAGREYRYVTLIDRRRSLGFHAHMSVPSYPASQGCVRLEPHAARLIHDNSIAGKTEILIDGTWTNPATPGKAAQKQPQNGTKNPHERKDANLR